MSTLAHARAATDALFDLVRPEAMYDRPIPERHRLAFYLGHFDAFDWNLLGGRPLHPTFDRLFAFGIDPAPGQLPSDQPSDWPSVEEIRAYCQKARAAIDAMETPEELRNVAIEHRLMHAETLAYLLHELPYDRKAAPKEDAALLLRW